ncbi:helix-turn-helix domain-containing protein [Nocardia terpenica]|uniref:HTH cro/C1-type domain-containing protein n=1 Tax=Nocardia terpenica TaxID=455432 RepID=A0A291RNA5_9NOCA|nr:helix-turn-helix domain-containing protein [Nocardia terpenica]ATL68759.1 hypothetical protein CRH09_23780 [Nocardia terpenica]
MQSVAWAQQRHLTVGNRIEMRRRQLGLSRRTVANIVGRSDEWLRLIESGQQRLENVYLIVRLAEVLHIGDFRQLIDIPPARPQPRTEGAEMLIGLFAPSVIGYPTRVDPAATVSIPQLREQLQTCQRIWASSPTRYSELGQRLPPVLAMTRMLLWRDYSDGVGDLALTAAHLARQVLTRLGAHTLALTVADRSMEIAGRLDRPGSIAAAAEQYADALLHLEQFTLCREHAETAAAELSPTIPDTADEAVLWGALQLTAAKSAVCQHNVQQASRLMARAHEVANRLGADRSCLGITFGPSEVGIARMEVALGENDFDEVIRTAATVEFADDHSITSQARYHIALAHAFVHKGEDVAAALALEKAATACPEDLRYDHNAHHTLQKLLRHSNGKPRRDVARLAALAEVV